MSQKNSKKSGNPTGLSGGAGTGGPTMAFAGGEGNTQSSGQSGSGS
jgi:hypothetical protein